MFPGLMGGGGTLGNMEPGTVDVGGMDMEEPGMSICWLGGGTMWGGGRWVCN